MSRSLSLLIVPLLAAACVSAAKRVDQGIRLEQSGRPAEAARRYADALRRDPSLVEVRTRLQETGDRAVADYLAAAAALPPDDAADQFVEADELLRLSAAVGVALRTPEDYPERRRTAFDRAIDFTLSDARAAGARGDWSGAANRLARAAARWEASDPQRAAIDRQRFDLFVAWADAALQAGEYRAAHQRAQQAIDLVGPGAPEAPRAMDVQAEAIRRGTIRVAVLPASVPSELRAELPGGLLDELNDDLVLNRWRRETPFVAVADPQDVAREARRRGYLRQVPTRSEARALADVMGADVAAMLVIDSLEVRETEVQQSRVAVRTRAGADTAYTLRTGRRQVRVRLAYTLMDVDGFQQPERGWVWADASERFRRGEYRGDPATLVLPRSDRELFSRRDAGLGTEQVRELAEDLGARLERELLEQLGRRVR